MAAAVWYLASSSLLNELMNERPPRWWKGRGGDVLTMFQGSDGGGACYNFHIVTRIVFSQIPRSRLLEAD